MANHSCLPYPPFLLIWCGRADFGMRLSCRVSDFSAHQTHSHNRSKRLRQFATTNVMQGTIVVYSISNWIPLFRNKGKGLKQILSRLLLYCVRSYLTCTGSGCRARRRSFTGSKLEAIRWHHHDLTPIPIFSLTVPLSTREENDSMSISDKGIRF